MISDHQDIWLMMITPTAPLHVLGSVLWRMWQEDLSERMPYAIPWIEALGALEDFSSCYGSRSAPEIIEQLIGPPAQRGARGSLCYWGGPLAEAIKAELWVRQEIWQRSQPAATL
mgnify:CR=1 FL=1